MEVKMIKYFISLALLSVVVTVQAKPDYLPFKPMADRIKR